MSSAVTMHVPRVLAIVTLAFAVLSAFALRPSAELPVRQVNPVLVRPDVESTAAQSISFSDSPSMRPPAART